MKIGYCVICLKEQEKWGICPDCRKETDEILEIQMKKWKEEKEQGLYEPLIVQAEFAGVPTPS